MKYYKVSLIIKKILSRISLLSDYKYLNKAYSQEGEDLILKRIFENTPTGFYVDVGAHHPKRFSNTYIFYRTGWRGINIEPMPGAMDKFRKIRPKDINLEMGVSLEEGKLDYYIYNEPALNSFSKDLHNHLVMEGKYKLLETRKVKVKPLAAILDQYSENKKINFLTIDVEGFDLEVLKSNNWEKYRPEYILVECLESNINKLTQDPVNKYLKDKGYDLFAKTFNTYFYKTNS